MNQGVIFIASFSEQLIREKAMMDKPDLTNCVPQWLSRKEKEYADHLANLRTIEYSVSNEQDGKELREGKDFNFGCSICLRESHTGDYEDHFAQNDIAIPIEPEPKEDNRISICEKISEDAKNDASAFDGMPFNGRTLATYLGYHGASISALAELVKSILEENAKK